VNKDESSRLGSTAPNGTQLLVNSIRAWCEDAVREGRLVPDTDEFRQEVWARVIEPSPHLDRSQWSGEVLDHVPCRDRRFVLLWDDPPWATVL
jgi:hypothetical protein